MSQAEDLARAALQGFFATPEFRDMRAQQRRRAVVAVQAQLDVWAHQEAELAFRRRQNRWGRWWDALTWW